MQNIKKMKGDIWRHFKKFGKFFEKQLKKRNMRILQQSQSAKKLERGDPLGFLKLCANLDAFPFAGPLV